MPETVDALFAFAAAAAIAWLLVPVAESLAWRIGAIDRPRERSLHVIPTPKLSGIAILVAVLASGATHSGCTVHLCDDEYDRGPILLQRTAPVAFEDDAEAIAARVFEEEKVALPEAIRLIAEGRVEVLDGRVRVRPE